MQCVFILIDNSKQNHRKRVILPLGEFSSLFSRHSYSKHMPKSKQQKFHTSLAKPKIIEASSFVRIDRNFPNKIIQCFFFFFGEVDHALSRLETLNGIMNSIMKLHDVNMFPKNDETTTFDRISLIFCMLCWNASRFFSNMNALKRYKLTNMNEKKKFNQLAKSKKIYWIDVLDSNLQFDHFVLFYVENNIWNVSRAFFCSISISSLLSSPLLFTSLPFSSLSFSSLPFSFLSINDFS